MTEYVYNDANGTLASVKHGEGRTLFKLITADEFRAMKESFPHHKEMLRSLGSVRYCKAEPYRDHIWGTLRIPNKNEARLPQVCLLFYMTAQELIFIGGGAGMAPLRAQIMHMTKTLHTTDRKMNFFYGARALNEVFYLDDFLKLEKEFPNFKFHLALDRPDPAADAAGVKYTPGFVHQVIYDTYLKDHESPEDIEYYMCGPGPMSKAVNGMLDSLGVDSANIHYDNFGG